MEGLLNNKKSSTKRGNTQYFHVSLYNIRKYCVLSFFDFNFSLCIGTYVSIKWNFGEGKGKVQFTDYAFALGSRAALVTSLRDVYVAHHFAIE